MQLSVPVVNLVLLLQVQSDCDGLQHQIEVRNITKKISDLNEKLDVSTTLSEPRENAFMR